ncbi:hypothetical protein RHODO2019_07420 [Rhodococcus antarcticus]|uniref:Uncharacterized protein n=1 Tax=Rhodococcus antarcticus TaxID=2987751 RepID=A0ABY6P3J1_9NOCA|nr:hypothetical protein [Rhodococcus antarcticus]UZJ26229.1 hypothetical protein RHODO2019_07420 [Rhodococcus antarcticus]
MSTPEQHRPPVYACAAGAVLHAHAGDTLEPAVLLHTFLPPAAAERLRDPGARVDVHSDGITAPTVTVRVLADGHALTWQLPVAPLVAALPGQSGDDGRVVLLAVVDAEPAPGSWGEALDCERLAAELPLPVAEVVEALRGRLAPWLAEDVELLLHDDAHDHAADFSPEQLVASAVLSSHRGALDADQATTRLVRGLAYGPPEFQVELARLVAGALLSSSALAGPHGVAAVLAETGPFEDEAVRLLTEVPRARGVDGVGEVLLATGDRDEAVRAAVGVIARLARVGLGATELEDDALLARLDMVDDAALARLAGLWVRLAVAAAGEPDGDADAVRAVADGVLATSGPGRSWLARTARALAAESTEVAGRQLHRVGAPLELVRAVLESDDTTADPGPLVHACLQLARFVRTRAGIGPGGWAEVPLTAAVQATGAALAQGVSVETGIDLLTGLLEPDLEAAEALDAFVCATAQLLVQAQDEPGASSWETQVAELLAAVAPGQRGPRWLVVGCLRSAHEHDPAAVDLAPLLADEPDPDLDRAASRAGVRGVLRDGIAVLGALAEVVGPAAGASRDDVFTFVLPAALAEHDLLRRSR